MAKAIAKRKRKLDWRHYPNEYKYRGGCKVAWHTYRTRKEAEECAEAARHNAVIKESLGYDFGYCSPGSITVLPDGKFEVCVP
jgi:hypothetical protein